MLVLLCVLEMANQGVELATKEEESYRGRVNNLSQASHVLGVMRHKFKDAQLADFSASCFGHLESVDRLAFNGQLVHILLIHRVANQGMKDLEGLTYLIGCEVPEFTKNDFCLITGLHCDKPYDLEVEPFNIRLLTKYFPQKLDFVGENSKGKGKGKGVKDKGKVTCAELEKAFKECKDEDDALKMRLVYFAKGVWAYKKIAQLEKPLRYCNMTDPVAILRILRWSTMNKQSIHEQVQMYITES
ncbi:hypothetical protein DVH24_034037 [Malus domestica]|uniref:DUF1985 domain-containing protein n=1 Tax=Malus domestica TaxID=3750 RepID=A0A498KMN9_MALDO|nr:hypothetical protein DVH24_034037 [Malus domestica]